jgi:hypothetical protein
VRYDKLLQGIEKATARYEAEMQRLLQRFAKADATTADALLASLPKRKTAKRKLHWTQRPENKAKMLKQLKRATAAKKAANGS